MSVSRYRAAAPAAATVFLLALPLAPHSARAEAAQSSDAAASADAGGDLQTVVVTARRLNEQRAQIETQTGASSYTIDSAAIAAMPGGTNVPLNQVLLQAPDVVQDSFGQLHVRGDHNDLQYRLNGIILPEGISVFSQTLSPRLISSLSLITGALPAEYGLRTAGIIDLTTATRFAATGGQRLGLRRQSRYVPTVRGVRRQFRQLQLLRCGGRAAQRFGHRVSGREHRSLARSFHPGSRVQLSRGYPGSGEPHLADPWCIG